MATLRCKCGAVLGSEDPDVLHLLFSRRDFDVDKDPIAWTCRVCGRPWVFWERGASIGTEYRRSDDEHARNGDLC